MAEGISFLFAPSQGFKGQILGLVPSVESKCGFVQVLMELHPPIALTPRYIFNHGLLLP